MFRKTRNEELDRLSVEAFKNIEKLPVVIILDNIRSAHNTGSVFRTSDAFRMGKIYLCGITATPPNKEIHKSALGATDSVEWEYVEKTEDLVIELKNKGYKVFAIEQTDNSLMLEDFNPMPGEKYVLIFGNEVKGVQQKVVDLCDCVIEIPQIGTKHSLNISVSAGVCLWEIFRKVWLKK